jgi:hypothetical protein
MDLDTLFLLRADGRDIHEPRPYGGDRQAINLK